MKEFSGRRCAGVTAVSLLIWAGTAAAGPVVPGYEWLRQAKDATAAERGEVLLSELNCLSCHTPDPAIRERIGTKSAPRIDEVGARVTPQYLKRFLGDPHGVKPGTTMPDVFHASEGFAKEGAIDFLVHYLVSQGGPIKASKTAVNRSAAQRGRELYHSVGCVACHAPENPEGITTPMVPLGNPALKTTVGQLTAFLLDPLHTRPSGRMPSLMLDEDEAHAIAMYLLREQMDNPQIAEAERVAVPGLRFEYFEGKWRKLPDFSKLEPKASGITGEISLDLPAVERKKDGGFGLRFTANLTVPRKAKYRFWLRSDDGSRLIVDGKELIDVDGIHPALERRSETELEEGEHTIEILYFEGGGEEELGLEISGGGIKKGPLPLKLVTVPDQTPMIPLESIDFTLDPQKVRMGRQMFSALRCVSCHRQEGLSAMRPAKPLDRLDVDSAAGCLGESVRKGVPNYGFSGGQRNALKAALAKRADLARPLAPEQAVRRGLATMNCYACHDRDGIGGPDDKRAEWFKTAFSIDLGEEGTIPPTLSGAGSKLKPAALERILFQGELHVRHYMAARMPQFGKANLGGLRDGLIAVDRKPGDLEAPGFSKESMKVGHRLMGTMGLACATCHNVNGSPALGIPGIDLVTAHERLNPGWFRRFLLNPAAVNEGTRMPAFWPGGMSAFQDLLEGDAEKQIDAIWNYLSLGDSMPRPAGMKAPGAIGDELVPVDRPIVHRTFMEGVGPRSILAGYPERVHAAFDANVVRLAKLWRGRFFDGSGVGSGRTDRFLKPLGSDPVDLPAGPALALIGSESNPWPKPEKTDRNVGGRFRGYRLDEQGRPVFRYDLEGVLIEEFIEPTLRPGGANIIRHFRLTAAGSVEGLYLLAARGDRIEKDAEGRWVVDGGRQRITIRGDSHLDPRVRLQDGKHELVAPVSLKGGKADFSLTIDW